MRLINNYLPHFSFMSPFFHVLEAPRDQDQGLETTSLLSMPYLLPLSILGTKVSVAECTLSHHYQWISHFRKSWPNKVNIENKYKQTRQHPYNGLFFRTTCVRWYQQGKNHSGFNEENSSKRWWRGSGKMIYVQQCQTCRKTKCCLIVPDHWLNTTTNTTSCIKHTHTRTHARTNTQYLTPSPSCTISQILPIVYELECGPMPNVMAALPNIGGAFCSILQSLADAHY